MCVVVNLAGGVFVAVAVCIAVDVGFIDIGVTIHTHQEIWWSPI